MFQIILLLIFGLTLVASRHDPFYRIDYTYVEEFDSFYKLHWDHSGASWFSAYLACEDEEATLFYPKTKDEWTVVKRLLTSMTLKPNVSDILIGIHDEFGFGELITVDGLPTPTTTIDDSTPKLATHTRIDEYDDDKMTSEVGVGTPTPLNYYKATFGKPACLRMNVDSGYFMIEDCNTANVPFVCKKHEVIEACPTVDKGYIYVKEMRKCYKVNEKLKTWSNAMQTCFMEGGSLLLMTSLAEAEIVKTKLSDDNKDYFVGFRKLFSTEEFHTIKGHKFDDTFYKKWYNHEKECGNIFRIGDILYTQTIDCIKQQAFVCEMMPKIYTWSTLGNQLTAVESN